MAWHGMALCAITHFSDGICREYSTTGHNREFLCILGVPYFAKRRIHKHRGVVTFSTGSHR